MAAAAAGGQGTEHLEAVLEVPEAELKRRLAWIQYYLKRGEQQRALELGWDGETSLEEMIANSPIMTSPSLAGGADGASHV